MPSERIRIGEDYYLLAAALQGRGRRRVLNHGDSFLICDDAGDIPLGGGEPYGLFHAGTRFLDRFELRLNGGFPFLLSASLGSDSSELVTYVTNADERRGGEVVVQRDLIALQRRKVLFDGTLFETLHLRNYGRAPFPIHLALLYTADFADVFELRGIERAARGASAPPRVESQRVVMCYRGLDAVERELELTFGSADWEVAPECATLSLTLAPGGETRVSVTACCRVGGRRPAVVDAAAALAMVHAERAETVASFPRLVSDNEAFNDVWNCGLRDLALLRARHPDGAYVYAGIPWFATVFGRDGLITALETLAFAPQLAVGILRRLAALQGQQRDAARDEEPGKILHELRLGEMAATGEIPFGRYYGSIDATPLFLVLLAAYADRTADLALVRELWPAALAALEWMRHGMDARGYLSYERRSAKGLVNQGWKDSREAISHADGRLAEPPIALCEVQAYVYAALRGVSGLARRLGDSRAAERGEAEADALRTRFARDFWLAEEGTYALALDRDGRPCRVVASNAGHCLFAGIAQPEHAAQVVARLMRADTFCGWGIRTLSADACRYNPMSYHNGSVWPHDNAILAAGFARYGFAGRAAELLTALFDASLGLEDRHLPELFCGFERTPRAQPVPYPVACSPQAWSAASLCLLTQATLGLSVDGWRRRLTFSQAALPQWLEHIEIRDLWVRDARVDLRIVRGRRSAALEIIARDGELDVIVRK